MPRRWFDAHLDLAYLAVSGRDMLASPDRAGGPDLPAAVTLPSLRAGHVDAALATIFIEPGDAEGPARYRRADPASASRAARAQLDVYNLWALEGHIALGTDRRRPSPHPGPPPLRAAILIEGADGIASPDELPWWIERGVAAVGLAWATGSRYAAGNADEPTRALTPLGREMVRAIDHARTPAGRRVLHDLSHLSDASLRELLELADGPVMASHSNCRSIIASRDLHSGAIPAPLASRADPARVLLQRHLGDDTIREIARRDGVIGINLYSPFLIPGAARDRRATIDESIAHVERVRELTGSTAHVGLGSDMDGGFAADKLPRGIDTPAGLARLADALSSRGWSDEGIHAFAWGNWARLFALDQP